MKSLKRSSRCIRHLSAPLLLPHLLLHPLLLQPLLLPPLLPLPSSPPPPAPACSSAPVLMGMTAQPGDIKEHRGRNAQGIGLLLKPSPNQVSNHAQRNTECRPQRRPLR